MLKWFHRKTPDNSRDYETSVLEFRDLDVFVFCDFYTEAEGYTERART